VKESNNPFVVDNELGLIVDDVATPEQLFSFLRVGFLYGVLDVAGSDEFDQAHGVFIAKGATRKAKLAEEIDKLRLDVKKVYMTSLSLCERVELNVFPFPLQRLHLLNLKQDRTLTQTRMKNTLAALKKEYIQSEIRELCKGKEGMTAWIASHADDCTFRAFSRYI